MLVMERTAFLTGKSIKGHQPNWENIKKSLVYKGKTKRPKSLGQIHMGAQPTSGTCELPLLSSSFLLSNFILLGQLSRLRKKVIPSTLCQKRQFTQWTINFWQLQALFSYVRASAFQEGSWAPVPQIYQLYRWENWHSLSWPWYQAEWFANQQTGQPKIFQPLNVKLEPLRHTSSSKPFICN